MSKAIVDEVAVIAMDISPKQAERASAVMKNFCRFVDHTDWTLDRFRDTVLEDYQRHRLNTPVTGGPSCGGMYDSGHPD